MKVVLFLDFDGVLHPQPCMEHELFEGMDLLAPVLRRFMAQTVIVISSSWREHHTLEELKVHFPSDLRHMVVGVTPVLQEPHENIGVVYERQREILAWLKRFRPTGIPWLAIDDWPQGFAPSCQDLLLTHYKCGIQPHDLSSLAAMLHTRIEAL